MSSKVPLRVEKALRALHEALRKTYGDAELYLFGSYAKGDWLEDSDVDVVVVSGLQGEEHAQEDRRGQEPSPQGHLLRDSGLHAAGAEGGGEEECGGPGCEDLLEEDRSTVKPETWGN